MSPKVGFPISLSASDIVAVDPSNTSTDTPAEAVDSQDAVASPSAPVLNEGDVCSFMVIHGGGSSAGGSSSRFKAVEIFRTKAGPPPPDPSQRTTATMKRTLTTRTQLFAKG